MPANAIAGASWSRDDSTIRRVSVAGLAGLRRARHSKVAYQLPQPTGMMSDIFIAGVPDLDGDEQDWVPQSPDVSFKPLVLSVSQGYYVNILRVRSSGILSRHRHTGPVHALTLRGR